MGRSSHNRRLEADRQDNVPHQDNTYPTPPDLLQSYGTYSGSGQEANAVYGAHPSRRGAWDSSQQSSMTPMTDMRYSALTTENVASTFGAGNDASSAFGIGFEKAPEMVYTSDVVTGKQKMGSKEIFQQGPFNKLIREFQYIGGNITSPREAKIICLGDNHLNAKHTELNAHLINHLAEEGDIVLLEGVPAGQECDQQHHEKTMQLTKWVNVFGWDDPKLSQQGIEIGNKRLEIAQNLNSGLIGNDEYASLYNEHEKLQRQEHAIRIEERNKRLKQVINSMRERFPDKKIFVLAGINHLEQDHGFAKFLNKDKYIAYKPLHELSDMELLSVMASQMNISHSSGVEEATWDTVD